MADAFAFDEVIRALLPALDNSGQGLSDPSAKQVQERLAQDEPNLWNWPALRVLGCNFDSISRQDRASVLDYLQAANAGIDPKLKFKIEHSGVALLIAYCLEGLQRAAARH